MERGIVTVTDGTAVVACGVCDARIDLTLDPIVVADYRQTMAPSLAKTVVAMETATARGWKTTDQSGWVCPRHGGGPARRPST